MGRYLGVIPLTALDAMGYGTLANATGAVYWQVRVAGTSGESPDTSVVTEAVSINKGLPFWKNLSHHLYIREGADIEVQLWNSPKRSTEPVLMGSRVLSPAVALRQKRDDIHLKLKAPDGSESIQMDLILLLQNPEAGHTSAPVEGPPHEGARPLASYLDQNMYGQAHATQPAPATAGPAPAPYPPPANPPTTAYPGGGPGHLQPAAPWMAAPPVPSNNPYVNPSTDDESNNHPKV
mmetsp:Transcript_9419/g.26878  ORF Transcript_9419/g.26878 Transcript_9419/m.26878 type:complete len:236 (-) Transcript_9419:136-843(-)|eukprot:CAMPEP_0117650744 /NCGR_PEP_ID=MMETSP0804-20121206/1703_1 /TAXON_ID=1074897 /ORGANISM="Tetraselmis astigmatica, Strain CCMP880" /LENGTH=235 /DNA_ID=CAMNT_0005456637 /DNA_START=89 /DNA_END=796 /DNA_ORIENTATION=-